MMSSKSKTTAQVAASAIAAGAARAAETLSGDALAARIKSSDDAVRGAAWQSAASCGAPAIKPVAELFTHEDFEVGRAAKRALSKIVRHAGRPGGDADKQAVVAELIPLLQHKAESVRRETLWMLSEIAGDEAVQPIAALLADEAVREDARAALERIPGEKSLSALKTGLETAPVDYRPAIAQSLRVRGVQVSGYPSRKLLPTRSSKLKPV